MCVGVCVCKSVPIVFTHWQSPQQEYHFHSCNNCKKRRKGLDAVTMDGLKFLPKDTSVCQCVCVRVCVSVCVCRIYDTCFSHNKVYESKFRVGDNTLQQLIMEKYMATHGN